ncbi:uncharacterized protein PGTG_09679 [Puccinia graminis f. sp. tritici CRL 75-36-700-3]|uniref:Uncharacterized protein n=1 Tax=Puccinia graminis f. sp. tritici (strain CRL 75-36-700-3 / race SCCL) TaxID=418459 RepID=E3KI41_PUCGT|nr:uncharacterized protein PGTG_09679 [Puccinia graminis f. sp. tritici CRL 75-36-700-3]EFP83966.1 hypothetical protein PGTG_09679 [Puccinia graminis f. sp. tritici CRL 75-36-700-3]
MNSDPKKHTQEFIKIVDPFFANDFLYKADALSESSFKLFECLHSPPNNWTYMHQKLQKKLSANLSSHQVIQTIQNAYRFFQNPSDMSVKGPINELMIKVIIPVKIHDRELIKDQLEFMKEAFNIFENEEYFTTKKPKFEKLILSSILKGLKMEKWVEKASVAITGTYSRHVTLFK